MRRGAIVVLALLAGAASAQPAPGPAAHGFAVGALRLWALRDGARVAPNDGTLFPAAPVAEVAALLRDAGASADGIPLAFDALLVRMPGRIVLIDTGRGPKAGGVLIASLAAAGVRPADVTDVLVTHSHGDHVGGLLDAAGRPAFPRARVRMAATEWEYLRARPANAALAAAIAPQVATFAANATPVPGITAVALPGHTPGHSGYRIASGGAAIVDIGDTAHSAIVSLARPGWTIEYDTDAAAGRAEREATLARLAAARTLVFAPHFPFPGTGRIARAGAGYRWMPGDR